MENFTDELGGLLRARLPFIYVLSPEEDRLEKAVTAIAQKLGRPVLVWTCFTGASAPGESTLLGEPLAPADAANHALAAPPESVLVVKDFHHAMEQPEVVRYLRDLRPHLRASGKTVFFVSPSLFLPPELEREMRLLEMPPPAEEELAALLSQVLESQPGSVLSKQQADLFVRGVRGLTFVEAEASFRRALGNPERAAAILAAERRHAIRKTQLVDLVEPNASLEDLVGLARLKNWVARRASAFTGGEGETWRSELRGVLLAGFRGCGKALAVRVMAATWELPLLRLDVSRLFDESIGPADENLRRALRIAEWFSPCLLWIEEADKVFGGQYTGSRGGVPWAWTLATWMEQREFPVFVAATATDVRQMPWSLLRRGRMDAAFFLDLPGEQERAEILASILKRHGLRGDVDVDRVTRACNGASGADIEGFVVGARWDASLEGCSVSTEHLLAQVEIAKLHGVAAREDVDAIRQWSRKVCQLASGGQDDSVRPREGRIGF